MITYSNHKLENTRYVIQYLNDLHDRKTFFPFLIKILKKNSTVTEVEGRSDLFVFAQIITIITHFTDLLSQRKLTLFSQGFLPVPEHWGRGGKFCPPHPPPPPPLQSFKSIGK